MNNFFINFSNDLLILYIIIILFNFCVFFNLNKILVNFSIIDKPDKIRKFHKKKAYLFGGTLILLNIMFFFLYHLIYYNFQFQNPLHFYSIFNPVTFLFFLLSFYFLGLYDDKYEIKPSIKLLFFFTFFYLLLKLHFNLIVNDLNLESIGVYFQLNSMAIIFTVFCLVILTNSLNMLDGQNCQLSLFCITILFFLTLESQNIHFYLFLILILIFFSILNFKGKIFLGDSGSILISFIIGYIVLMEHKFNINFYSDEVFLLLFYPIIDFARVFFVRLINGKSPFFPDRNHIHHLINSKLNFYKTTLVIFSSYFIPLSMHFIFNINTFISILAMLVIYFLTIFFFQNKKFILKK
jgi:UDP-GlcNAc:undecaprenyl-phosphate GlcNAc-1-phosphate transferase